MEHKETEKIETFAGIPVIPLRGIVLMPYSVLGFDIGRNRGKAAVEAAGRNGMVLLVTQKDPHTDNPKMEDLYEIGCIGRVKEWKMQEDNTMRVLVEGIVPARLLRFDIVQGEFGEHCAADAVTIAEIEPEYPEQSKELRKKIGELTQALAEKVVKDNFEATIRFISKTSGNAEYAFRIANIFLRSQEDRQSILEANGQVERSLTLIRLLSKELEVRGLNERIEKAVQEALEKNQREYILREQIRAAQKELGADEQSEADEFRKKLESGSYPEEIRQKLDKEITHFASLPAGSHETPSMRTYIETLLELPYTNYSEDDLDIENARRILNEDHYGLTKVKERILEYIAVARLTGKVNGQIICFVGPPGVGKTSVSASIARALGRKFVRMSLGGIRDEAEIRGHRRTYIGAMPGRVINAMRQAGTVNPVLLFDEIDKLASDIHGDPAAAMLEVLDSAQNFAFRDHFLEVPYDLSKVLFITTANNAATIPGPLKDRMEIIEVPSYLANEKVEIAARHLLPRQMELNGLKKSMLRIGKPIIAEIVNGYTREAGVRGLERKLAAVCRKAACEIAEGKKSITLTKKKLSDYLGAAPFSFDPAEREPEVGLVNGLAWTSVGGETLEIEVAALAGSGRLQLTGQLGEVMQESAKTAITCIRERAASLGLAEDFFEKTDVHIHIPEGAVPKDGPSAGVSLLTAVASALTGIPVKAGIAMTGEITLRGRVLPIGGLREKLLAAARAGIKTVLLPEKNRKDLQEVPEDILDAVHIIYVKDADEVLSHALTRMPHRRIVMPDPSVPVNASSVN